jgi:hypothetical protein
MENILFRLFDNLYTQVSPNLKEPNESYPSETLTPEDHQFMSDYLQNASLELDSELIDLLQKLKIERESLLQDNALLLSQLIKEYSLKRVYR